ncbi:hypothetical protein [Microlunatus parietis]|uniref:Beta-galactosidase trimerisation domain-containing protein n=1 Tax=Microlunatus parietis TaxID=682979 RepID=A0A7Y9I7U2_9ACTN|nr:hypothetical protein [Microlunatus parietis]NYE71797.1 hypothetical protein [Microlunatus parietis]
MDSRSREATGFQESAPYDPRIDLRTDFVMVYGLDDSTAERIARWREAGYRVHLMTGISWGKYQDYLDGRWDGTDHWSDAQTDADGRPILHGESTDIPYLVPTITFTEYLIEKLAPIVDLDLDGLHLEEPEFWARGGYAESFRREWLAYYGEPWQPPHSSVEAHYRSGQLMQHLLTRSLDRVTTVLRDRALHRGRDLRCYVPTHSLLNYTQWQIVSPESRLRELPAVHGAIAQVWTGTSRTPNVYAGRHAERTFETAFLEYGIAQDLTRGTDRTLWFLHDPIEDHPGRTWEDYRDNYHRTLVASLLHPGVDRFEVTPWPRRVFTGRYLREGSGERVPIPADYATSYLITMNALRDLDQADVSVETGGPRIGVMLSDTAMFQRWLPGAGSGEKYDGLQGTPSEESRRLLDFSAFYGLALPPLFAGRRVVPVQLEALLDDPTTLDDHDLIILSYEFQKPRLPVINEILAGWVRRGGALLHVGDGADPYHGIRSWWTGRYPTPGHHLAETLGVDHGTAEPVPVGKGWVRFVAEDPAGFTDSPESAGDLVAAIRGLAEAAGQEWRSGGWLSVHRGPYLIGAVLSEAAESISLTGRYLDLLDPDLPVITERTAIPGDVVWLRDLDHEPRPGEVLASAGRIRDQEIDGDRISHVCEVPAGIEAITALRLPERPGEIRVDGVAGADWDHEAATGVLWVRHPGDPSGTAVQINR